MESEDRHVQLQGSSNLRDIGGYRTACGRRVRRGRVFRSGSLWGLTEADWGWMDATGFAVLCDLRSDAERDLAPAAWAVSKPPRQVDAIYDARLLFDRSNRELARGVGGLEASLYATFAQLLAPSFKGLFQALANGDAPAIVHCTAGQDRTGLAVALLLGALGVETDAIHADYLLSTQLRRPAKEMDLDRLSDHADSNVVAAFYVDLIARKGADTFRPKSLVDDAGRPMVTVALAAIERQWGSVDAYLADQLGMGPSELEALRGHLLEPG